MFQPLPGAQAIALVSTGSSVNGALARNGSFGNAVETVNTTDNLAFVAFGTDDTVAAVIPVGDTPGAFPVPANSTVVFQTPPGTKYAALIGAESTTVYVTPGIVSTPQF